MIASTSRELRKARPTIALVCEEGHASGSSLDEHFQKL
jgi:hypothetical protein